MNVETLEQRVMARIEEARHLHTSYLDYNKKTAGCRGYTDLYNGTLLVKYFQHHYVFNYFMKLADLIKIDLRPLEKEKVNKIQESIKSIVDKIGKSNTYYAGNIFAEAKRFVSGPEKDSYSAERHLYYAIEGKDVDLFEASLFNGADINKSYLGRVPIVDAATSDNFYFIKQLLEKDINVDLRDNGGNTALIKLCQSNHPEALNCIEKLITLGANINLPCFVGSPLMVAIASGRDDIVARLLQVKGIDVNFRLLLSATNTALGTAISVKNIDIVKGLLRANATIEQKDLNQACYNGSLDIIIELIQTNAPQLNFASALLSAASNGQQHVVEYLCSNHLILDIKNLTRPLAKAITQGHSQVAKYLISQGADLEATKDELHCNEVTFAAAINDVNAVMQYLSEGKDINALDEKGHSALYRASNAGFSELVAKLLEMGADPNATPQNTHSPIVIAASRGDLDTLTALLKAKKINFEQIEVAKKYANKEHNTSIVSAISNFQEFDKLKNILKQVANEYTVYNVEHCKFSFWHRHGATGRKRVNAFVEKAEKECAQDASELKKILLEYIQDSSNGNTYPHSFRTMLLNKIMSSLGQTTTERYHETSAMFDNRLDLLQSTWLSSASKPLRPE